MSNITTDAESGTSVWQHGAPYGTSHNVQVRPYLYGVQDVRYTAKVVMKVRCRNCGCMTRQERVGLRMDAAGMIERPKFHGGCKCNS